MTTWAVFSIAALLTLVVLVWALRAYRRADPRLPLATTFPGPLIPGSRLGAGDRRVGIRAGQILQVDRDDILGPDLRLLYGGARRVMLGGSHGNAGIGLNRQLPHLGNAGQGSEAASGASTGSVPTSATPGRASALYELANRLRRVRVCCGDWTRVVTTGALNYGATKGVLLDPPYLGDVRTSDLYAVDDHHIAHDVREWALSAGDNPAYRIILCGYEPEHIDHMPDTWTMVAYSASKSYGSSAGGGVNDANRHLERLWLSPHCVQPSQQIDLFGGAA